MFEKIYKNSIIEKPKLTLLILIFLLLSFGYFAKNFQLDASSDTLLLENDPDLKYLREVNTKYGSKDFLVLTYTPKDNLLAPNTIKNLTNLKNDLVNLEWANNVITILDVPLLKNNDDPLAERIKNFKTLSSEGADKERGFNEIINSPIYKEFIISKDSKTSGILVYIKIDKKLSDLIKTKNNYLNKINIKKSLWKGECFVFDNRVSVKHKLSPGSYSMCRGCRMPISVQEKKSSKYKEGISCPYCYNK